MISKLIPLLLSLLISSYTPPLNKFNNFTQYGKASWYGGKFHGRTTACGSIFDKNKITAAHKFLPCGTMIEVTNIKNKKKIVCVVNDRGPYIKNRILDLSEAAFSKIGNKNSGVIIITLKVIKPDIKTVVPMSN